MNMLVRFLVALVILLVLAGLLSVALTSANSDRGAFAAANKLTQLEAALELYRSDKGGFPADVDSTEIAEHMSRTYGEEVAQNPKLKEIDRTELLTILLSQQTWPIEHKTEEIYYDFDERFLFDSDKDGWLEYRYRDDRLFLIRNGEVCLWNEETNRYQFSQ